MIDADAGVGNGVEPLRLQPDAAFSSGQLCLDDHASQLLLRKAQILESQVDMSRWVGGGTFAPAAEGHASSQRTTVGQPQADQGQSTRIEREVVGARVQGIVPGCGQLPAGIGLRLVEHQTIDRNPLPIQSHSRLESAEHLIGCDQAVGTNQC